MAPHAGNVTMLMRGVPLRNGVLTLVLHTAHSPSEAEWAAFLRDSESHLIQSQPNRGRGLVFSDGFAPSSKQRSEMFALARKYRPRTISSIVTNSSVVRGVVTALNWVSELGFSGASSGALVEAGLPRAFKPSDILQALDSLDVAIDERGAVWAAAVEASKTLHVEVLKQSLEAVGLGSSRAVAAR